MDELERLFASATARATPRGADRSWMAAAAVLERGARLRAVAAVPGDADDDRPAGAAATIDPVATSPGPRRGPRLLAVAATIALLVTGAAIRWSSAQRGTGTSIVRTSNDGSEPTSATIPSTASPEPTTTTAPDTTGPAATTATTVASPARTTSRIGVFGDSAAMLLGYGLDTWARGRAVTVTTDGARVGCALVRFDRTRIAQYGESPDNPECDWATRWSAVLDAHPLDLAVVYSGAFDLADMTFDGDPTWHHVGDPVGDAHLRAAVDEVIGLFDGRATKLAFVLAPHVDFGRADPVLPATPYPISDPARVDRFNQILRDAAGANPNVLLIDLPAELARAFPGGEMDTTARPDGVHLSNEGAVALMQAGLGDELVAIAGGPVDRFVLDAPTIGFFGDSTALMTGIGTQGWGFVNLTANVVGQAKVGCGLLATGSVEFFDLNGVLTRQPAHEGCTIEDLWPAFLRSHPPLSLAVVQYGLLDVADHQLPGDEQWRHVGDPVLDQAVRKRIAAAMETFTSRGVPVAWLAAPHIDLGRLQQPPGPAYPMDDPARIDRFNELVREVAATHPLVTVLDLPGYLAQLPGGEMAVDVRPDGLHFTPESATKIATDWLGPELRKIAG